MSRYIDAEILLDAMRHITLGETDVARSEMKIVHYICHMPHIDDVRENVKGMWVKVVDRTEMYDKEGVKTWGMLFQCNQCGFVLNAIEGHTDQYNYCPNCGADMRPITALSKNAEIDSNSKRGES